MRHIQEYHRPTSVEEAVALKRAHGERGAYLAGGTDLMVVGPPSVEAVIDIRHAGINDIETGDGVIRLGGATRLREAEAAVDRVAGGMLRVAFRETAPWLIRNAATVSGNIANASPAADAVPALIALDAHLTIRGDTEDRVSIESILRGPHQTTLGDRLITAIEVPVERRRRGVFIKHARSHSDIAQVNVAVSAIPDSGRLLDVRIVVGAASPVPLRMPRVEALIGGQVVDQESLREVEKVVQETVQPISDWRASAEYRRRVSGVLVRRALHTLASGGAE